MQAILCRYINPTNGKGARIKASCVAGSTTIDYPHEAHRDEAHRDEAHQVACRALQTMLADKHGKHWAMPMVGGTLPNGDWVFVFVP